MKELLDYYHTQNKNKFIISLIDIDSKMNNLFSFSLFKTLKKQIEEILGEEKILFGLEETSSGILFTDKFFILCGGSSGIRKLDYRIFKDLTLRPKTLTKKGCYLLNNEPLYGLGTTNKDFINSFEEIKKIISTMDIDFSTDTEEISQERSINLFGIGGLKNEQYRIKETQRGYELQIVDLKELNSLISDRQKEILTKENGQEYLQKFIRLLNYITEVREDILKKLTKGKVGSFTREGWFKIHIEQLESDNGNLESLHNISIYLITNFLNEDMVKFFEIYESLDKLGVFNSGFENKLLEELGSINEKLRRINSKLTYLNILTTYNTFQLSTIKNKS